MYKVCIAISTYGERIKSIELPNPLHDVYYLIIHQNPPGSLSTNTEDLILRKDVEYIALDNIGLSRSRNTALLKAEAEYIHVMDDDVEINADNILQLAEMASIENIDIAIGYFNYRNGNMSKKYQKMKNIGVRNFFSVCSIEMCIKNTFQKEKILFDENFGLGTSNPSGEELIYLADSYKKNLTIKYYPLSVGIHPDVTSGDDFFSSNEKIIAKRKMLERAFPKNHVILKVLFLIKKSPILFKNKCLYSFFKIFFK